MDRNSGQNGDYIVNLSRGYWASQALFWGVEAGVFTMLEQKKMGAGEIAGVLRTDPAATERILNTLVSLGLLTKESRKYQNSRLSDLYLVKGKKSYLGNTVHHARNQWEGWNRLEEAVRTGKGVAFEIVDKNPYEQRLRDFLLAMRDNASLTADKITKCLNWTNRNKMLDLGGGPGFYTAAILEKYPTLRATIYDLESSITIAKKMLDDLQVQGRISFQSGNFIEDDVGEELYDAVFAANVFHIYDDKINAVLAKNIYRALRPGGQLAVYDYVLEEENPASEAALFDLNMLIGTVSGRNYSLKRISKLLHQAGFRCINDWWINHYSALILADKTS